MRAYVNGEYQLAKTDRSSNTYVGADVTGSYTDSSISFDVRVVDAQAETSVHVFCRWMNNRGYRAELRPENRTFAISRSDGDINNATYLVPVQPSVMLRRGVTNHIELSCV